MPFMTKLCRKCNNLESHRMRSKPNTHLAQSVCRNCEKVTTQKHQKNNPEKWREYNRQAYLKRVGGALSRRISLSDTERAEYAREKAIKRATRAKKARVAWDKELTDFVTLEAHKLCKLRFEATNFEWHVDHVIPLKGKIVSGLHIWNNLAVIPKIDNLRKGNSYSIHD